MIVQSASPDGSHFVIAMRQHTTFAGQLARHFGNDEFAGLEPQEPMEYMVANHDAGWVDLDAASPQDPGTGLPYNLVATPLTDIIGTSAGSPAVNEAHHPFSGVISSMHTYGLYHGRYGLSDKIFLDAIPDELRETAEAMLDGEQARQQRLRADLAADPDTAPFAGDGFLFHAYKQLQFFDTFSLYLHMKPAGERGTSAFPNVPRAVGDDVEIDVEERPGSVYALDPYPFDADGLELATEGRYLVPQPAGTDLAAKLAATEVSRQAVTLVAA
ncbi:MAG: DUF3891 family protein [Ilumatobacteraceae bacterium]